LRPAADRATLVALAAGGGKKMDGTYVVCKGHTQRAARRAVPGTSYLYYFIKEPLCH